MEIKICGITNLTDACMTAAAGADALGFVFYEKSPRYVTPETAREISMNISRQVARVGVFVNQGETEMREIARFCLLDFIQLHGNQSPEYCAKFPASRVIKAVSPSVAGEITRLERYSVMAFLFDTYDPVRFGGTGKTCNWEMARKAAGKFPIILAGGLNESNILSAIRSVSPMGVDIGSGVEVSPGRKDPDRVRGIIALVNGYRALGEGKPNTKLFSRFANDSHWAL
jgi:phosphoribosylanthranilate isomerase